MKHILFIAAAVLTCVILKACMSVNGNSTNDRGNSGKYSCIPCGSGCDTLLYEKQGTCGHCNMQLVDKKTIRHAVVNPENLCGYMAAKPAGKVLLLDVRSPEEFNGTAPEKFGRLQNAVNIPVQQLQQRIAELELYKGHEIIVYCSHSHRSPRASYILTQSGFKNVTNMAGGMSVWQQRTGGDSSSRAIYVPQ